MKHYWYTILLSFTLLAAASASLPPQISGFSAEEVFRQMVSAPSPSLPAAVGSNGGTNAETPSNAGSSEDASPEAGTSGMANSPSAGGSGSPSGSQPAGESGSPSGSQPAGEGGSPSASQPAGESSSPSGSQPAGEGGSPSGSQPAGGSGSPSGGQPAGDGGSPSSSNAPVLDFSNTLFIGDSRTEGIKEYGGLSEADFFANSGLSTFNVFSVKETVRGGGKQTLEQVLSSRSYEKIYLMLGINELGYSKEQIAHQYRQVLEQIQTLQPGAYVILEANLHVTKEKSDSSPVFNNGKINELNNQIYQLAVEKHCGYLDVNGLFDDGQGNLDPQYSSDSTHVMGKYYAVWGQWLRTQAV